VPAIAIRSDFGRLREIKTEHADSVGKQLILNLRIAMEPTQNVKRGSNTTELPISLLPSSAVARLPELPGNRVPPPAEAPTQGAEQAKKNERERNGVRPRQILRFHKSERMLHWSIAIPFVVCFASAVALVIFYNPHPNRAFRYVFAWTHRISGACLMALPVLALWRHRSDYKVHLENVKEGWIWALDDVKWLMLMGAAAISSKVSLPPQGKFNAAEKLNFMMVMTFSPLFVATGLMIWAFKVAFLSWVLHVGLAAMAAPLILGHIFMATINPASRVGLSGMLTGYVDRHWAEHHYTRWYRQKFENPSEARKPAAKQQAEHRPVQRRPVFVNRPSEAN
jgi:formate dehydrogenase subunit gamma